MSYVDAFLYDLVTSLKILRKRCKFHNFKETNPIFFPIGEAAPGPQAKEEGQQKTKGRQEREKDKEEEGIDRRAN